MFITTHYSIPFRQRPKRFEAFWLTDPTCNEVVSDAWSSQVNGSSAYRDNTRIKFVLKHLLHWNKYYFGKIQLRINELAQKLHSYQGEMQLSSGMQLAEYSTIKELEQMMHCEAILWAKKSQHMWLLHGDQNSRFFHSLVKGRHIEQKVLKLKDEQGNWTSDYETLEHIALSHFQAVYSAQDLPSL